jgi:hypothetical protein
LSKRTRHSDLQGNSCGASDQKDRQPLGKQ